VKRFLVVRFSKVGWVGLLMFSGFVFGWVSKLIITILLKVKNSEEGQLLGLKYLKIIIK
jgi:hypothetical protein